MTYTVEHTFSRGKSFKQIKRFELRGEKNLKRTVSQPMGILLDDKCNPIEPTLKYFKDRVRISIGIIDPYLELKHAMKMYKLYVKNIYSADLKNVKWSVGFNLVDGYRIDAKVKES